MKAWCSWILIRRLQYFVQKENINNELLGSSYNYIYSNNWLNRNFSPFKLSLHRKGIVLNRCNNIVPKRFITKSRHSNMGSQINTSNHNVIEGYPERGRKTHFTSIGNSPQIVSFTRAYIDSNWFVSTNVSRVELCTKKKLIETPFCLVVVVCVMAVIEFRLSEYDVSVI